MSGGKPMAFACSAVGRTIRGMARNGFHAPLPLDRVHQGDCLELLARLPDGAAQLAFADPPFNIGYDYDAYDDDRSAEDYLAWSRRWMGEIRRVLDPAGTFWLAIGDEYAAELKVLATRELGFTCRSWVIWYYTFGVNCKYKFSRSHAHLFHFVKDPQRCTFNLDAIRVPSARELVYGDRRANAKGRLPDDTWILRPQDLPAGFSAEENTWYFPRVCGTFKERSGWHGCQMPEQLLGRIIRACSNPGDLVIDPFGGSGTTLAVAKKLGRSFLGLELSEEYAARIDARLGTIAVGDPLDGAPEPLKSAPATKDGRRLDRKKPAGRPRKRAAGAERRTKRAVTDRDGRLF
jgi:site-specific DNA-methyltransferase (adenine-specific)